jgi:hypothetical protein
MITAFIGSSHMARQSFEKSDFRLYSQVLMSASFVAILLSGLGYLGQDIWLASTQWLLVSVVLASFGIYFRLN